MSSTTKRTAAILAACLGLTLGLVAWAVVGHLQKAPFTIEVDGKPLATVESRATAGKVLADVQSKADGGRSIRFTQEVTLRKARANEEVSALSDAVGALGDAVSVEGEGWAIIVNDQPVIALPRENDARETLDLVKKFYEGKVKSLYSRSTFKESVSVDKRYVEAGRLCSSPDEAVSVLTTTSERPQTHVVEQGDRAVRLAEQYGITLPQLKALNPRIDLNKLIEGDTLTIRLPKLPITVVCKSLVTETTNVSPPEDVRYGPRSGTRVSKMLVTYENGLPAGEETISQVTTWDRPTGRSYQRHRRNRSSRSVPSGE